MNGNLTLDTKTQCDSSWWPYNLPQRYIMSNKSSFQHAWVLQEQWPGLLAWSCTWQLRCMRLDIVRGLMEPWSLLLFSRNLPSQKPSEAPRSQLFRCQNLCWQGATGARSSLFMWKKMSFAFGILAVRIYILRLNGIEVVNVWTDWSCCTPSRSSVWCVCFRSNQARKETACGGPYSKQQKA